MVEEQESMEREPVIIGCGLGTPGTLTQEAAQALSQCTLLTGSKRLVQALAPRGVKRKATHNNDEILDLVRANPNEQIGILVSGDPGFFSTARDLTSVLGTGVTVYPGISCLSALCAKLRLPEDEVKCITVDGRENDNVAYEISRSKFTCILTGGANSASAVLDTLFREGLGDLKVACGSSLGEPEEEIFEGTVRQACQMDFPELTTLLIWNTEWAKYSVIGLPDESFFRGTVPMTKYEVRNVTASKLEVRADDIIYDVGAGTGSVSVELSRRAYLGRVYSIERLPEAIYLLKKNRQHLRAFNMEIIPGEAPEAFAGLPAPDKVFIGGSGGNISEIIGEVLKKNDRALIAATAATLETLQAAREAFAKYGRHPEVIQAGASRLVQRGNAYTMFEAINPVFIMVGKP